MAILTTSGRAAYQEALASQTFHLAWGSGDESWGGTPPAEDPGAVSLLAEVGRREALQVIPVVPDVAGSIILPGGAYEPSAGFTRYLYVDFHFDFGDADGETIREVGVFMNTEREGGVSPSQAYLLPAEVADEGKLMILEHQASAIIRSAAARERFRYVITL